ncbi:MAG TPA: DUF2807 domain-containing protein [Erythrobacter sp.]|nr:DUF2807 domain-containing protein [Erythrobacter sp.]
MLNRFFKRMAPLAAIALGAAVSGCDRVEIKIDGVDMDGVPLSELDTSGDAPKAVAMFGPDSIIITEGEDLSIEVEGDDEAVDAMRFTLEKGRLGVTRDFDIWDEGKATVRVTMPAPEDLSMAGSGHIESFAMANRAEINIGGSGSIKVDEISSERLDVNIGGSGDVSGKGTAERLDVNIGGSGHVRLAELKADRADINIAGSGDVSFASDGRVEANIIGSGDVTVKGSAKCEVNAIGSGTLNCDNSSDSDEEVEAEAEES